MAIGALLGAGSVLGGGLLSSIGELFGQDNVTPGDAVITSLDQRNDPLNVALAFDALIQLGNLDGAQAILQRGNPLNQVLSYIDKTPLDLDTKNSAAMVAKFVYENGRLPSPTDIGDLDAWAAGIQRYQLAIGSAGVPKPLLDQLNPQGASNFNAGIKSQIDKAASTGIGEARTSALRQLSKRITDMENGGTGSFEGLRDVATKTLEQQRDETARKQIQDTLAAANAGGYNPAGILAEIEKERLRQATATPLQATQLASTLASNEDRDLQNLLTFLGFGSKNAQDSAQITNNAAIGSAGIAANQLAAANAARQQAPNTTGNALGAFGSSLSTAGLLTGSGFFSSPKPGVNTQPTFNFGGKTTNDTLFNDSAMRMLWGG